MKCIVDRRLQRDEVRGRVAAKGSIHQAPLVVAWSLHQYHLVGWAHQAHLFKPRHTPMKLTCPACTWRGWGTCMCKMQHLASGSPLRHGCKVSFWLDAVNARDHSGSHAIQLIPQRCEDRLEQAIGLDAPAAPDHKAQSHHVPVTLPDSGCCRLGGSAYLCLCTMVCMRAS
jgi:hypothetical protein